MLDTEREREREPKEKISEILLPEKEKRRGRGRGKDKEPRKQKKKKHMKNVMELNDGYIVNYNFGIRKPVLNSREMVFENHPWNDCLMDRWVYYVDSFENVNVYFKHLYIDKRIIQIVLSGLDIMGDGVYLLYKAHIEFFGEEKEDFMVVPDDFSLKMASFECEDYIRELLNNRLISKEEYRIFSNKERRQAYAKEMNLIKMKAP